MEARAAAEAKLGVELDPQYRELLAMNDEWRSFRFDAWLFGTAELGASKTWVQASEVVDIAVDLGKDYSTHVPNAKELCPQYTIFHRMIMCRLIFAMHDFLMAGTCISLYREH